MSTNKSSSDLTRQLQSDVNFINTVLQQYSINKNNRRYLQLDTGSGAVHQVSEVGQVLEGAVGTDPVELQQRLGGTVGTFASSAGIFNNNNELLEVAPGPAPAPVYPPGPETQLLINPEFTDIISNGATGWVSTRGWQARSDSGSAPTAIITMPIRTDIYPTSSSTGFVIFTYISATISQTVSNIDLSLYNTITGVLNIANVSNRLTEVGANADTFTFQIQYKDAIGTVLYTSTTGSIRAPTTWTDYTLTLERFVSQNFDLIKTITVSITGLDSGFWAGQYGPAIDYCRLAIS